MRSSKEIKLQVKMKLLKIYITSENIIQIYKCLVILKKYLNSLNFSFLNTIIPKLLDILRQTHFSFLIIETLQVIEDIHYMHIIIENNCAQVLLKLFETDHYQIVERAAYQIGLLCREQRDFAQIIIQNSGIKLLINFIWKQKEEKHQTIALKIIPSILTPFKDDFVQIVCRVFLELKSLTETLSKLIRNSNDEGILESSCESIFVIAMFYQKFFFESRIDLILTQLIENNSKQSIILKLISKLINFGCFAQNFHINHSGFFNKIEKLIEQKQIEYNSLANILICLVSHDELISRIAQSKIIVWYLFQGFKLSSSKIHNINSFSIINRIILSSSDKNLQQLISFGLFNQLLENLLTPCYIENTMKTIEQIFQKLQKKQKYIYIRMLLEISGELLLAIRNEYDEIQNMVKNKIKLFSADLNQYSQSNINSINDNSYCQNLEGE